MRQVHHGGPWWNLKVCGFINNCNDECDLSWLISKLDRPYALFRRERGHHVLSGCSDANVVPSPGDPLFVNADDRFRSLRRSNVVCASCPWMIRSLSFEMKWKKRWWRHRVSTKDGRPFWRIRFCPPRRKWSGPRWNSGKGREPSFGRTARDNLGFIVIGIYKVV